MTATSNKLWATAGAFALAASAVLVPMAAQAEPGDTDSSASSDTDSASSDVGSAAGRSAARTNRGGATRAPAGAGAAGAGAAGTEVSAPPESVVSGARAATRAPAANNFGPNPLFQNPLWWFGTPNPTPPPPAFTNTFDPLADLPGWSRGYYGWYSDLNFEACVLGLSNSITPSAGPYGTSTSSISTGGC